MARSGDSSVVGRSCRRWHLGPGVDWDVPLGPGHLGLGRERLSRERCSGRRQGGLYKPTATRLERQRSVESVGAGAGSSARSWLVLRGGVVHRWSLRIPLLSRSAGQWGTARAWRLLHMALHLRQRLFMKAGLRDCSPQLCCAIAVKRHQLCCRSVAGDDCRHTAWWTETLS